MFDSNKALCAPYLDTHFHCHVDPNLAALVSTTIPVTNVAAEQVLQWLALGLTPGLGPTRARHLVEHFGNVGAIFRASLTELEATGLLAVSAQALGTGKSLELAHEELEKAKAAGAKIVTFDDSAYPARLRQITTRRSSSTCAAT